MGNRVWRERHGCLSKRKYHHSKGTNLGNNSNRFNVNNVQNYINSIRGTNNQDTNEIETDYDSDKESYAEEADSSCNQSLNYAHANVEVTWTNPKTRESRNNEQHYEYSIVSQNVRGLNDFVKI